MEFITDKFANITLNDDNRYSRQLYTIGKDVMHKLNVASVLVVGYNTLSQEIIKNLALLGINKISIDQNNILENYQKTGLYYSQDNYLSKLKELNPTINIDNVSIIDELIQHNNTNIINYNLVIVTNLLIKDAIIINNLLHNLNIPFIMTGCYGLMGFIFNDFCDNYMINDIDGEDYENLIIEEINGKIIKFRDNHKLSEKDILLCNNDHEIFVKQILTPFSIEVADDINQDILFYNTIIKKKIKTCITFDTLENNLQNPNFTVSDFSVPFNRSSQLHSLHKAYCELINNYDYNYNNNHFESFYNNYLKLNNNDHESLLLSQKFYYTSKGDLLPFASIIGGIVSHEVLKLLGHKYIPIQQWFYFDYFDLINDIDLELELKNILNKTLFKPNDKYEGIYNIFGINITDRIQNSRPFIIGSGAIGCELLKNLGMLGVKNITITDNDNIEISNLSRQFLFNDKDILKSKSVVAAEKIKLMNPDVDVISYEHKVCNETENIFDIKFHKKIDIYLNALDNVEARIYMDMQSNKYEIPLIDSGTMGSNGNVQVILPYITENYRSSKDPDESNNIPICTIKSFPYKQEHTIQWARELFENEFIVLPNLITKYKNIDKLNELNQIDKNLLLKQLSKYINFKVDEESFNKILLTIYYENFDKSIDELIQKYKDDVDNKRKLPIKIKFTRRMINNYMISGFNILNQIFNSNIKFNKISIDPIIIDINETIDKNDETYNTQLLMTIINNIPNINKIEFDKDNDNLQHIFWINECSNIRNTQYLIPITDIYQTRKIAGKIIPAMITTTSIIAGFQILEFIKIIKYYNVNIRRNHKYDKKYLNLNVYHYKNRFVNLNINYYDGIEPVKCKKYYKIDNTELNKTNHFSIWSKIFIGNNNNTKNIINLISGIYNKNVEFITSDNKPVYDGENILIETINLNSNNLVLLEDVPVELLLTTIPSFTEF